MRHFVLLVLILSLVGLSHASTRATRDVSKTLPLKMDGKVSIDTYKGSITITTWKRPQVEVYAKIEADDGIFENGEQNVQDTDIRIEGSDTLVRITSEYGKLKHKGSLPFVHYRITMPRTAHVRVKDYKSTTTISDLHADVDLNTYKGEVEVRGLDGSMRLETYKGEAQVGFARFSKPSQFEIYKGEITITIPKGTGFEIDAHFGGRVDFSSDFEVAIRSHGKRQDVEYHGAVNGGGPLLQLKSSRGTISLRHQ